MASLNVSAASTLASEGMITTDDYATFLNTLGEEASGISEFLAVEGAMHQQDCYDEKMAEDVGSSCLMRRGEPGNYFYECTGGTSSTPLHFMSALDAELYCRWSNSALAPSPHASSERDPLLKTNITTFAIQIAHDGTQGNSLHQAMGEEEIIEPCILETLEEIIGLVVVSGALARIFHTDSAAACEHLMDTASASNCSSGSMKHTAVVAIHHLPCLDQDSRRLAMNQYEICGLGLCFLF